ncbi:hypothetical protein [Streptomyces sp. TLI_171]|uniref:hypothetical protein n=1 Tax=Streptomyces sp. TLI_171 TaxID=1938859 RepID=UPI000C3FA678|nr:hypothetical protein [Streptomyces sp. TLI_171]RKE02896.1 hypothetical protein BX266_7498 [Streptomyces sp. TLI_171]
MDQLFAVAWQYVVGIVQPEELPMQAAQLLTAGMDSPALRDLAGRGRREDTAELAALFRRAVHELGSSVPDAEAADRCLLHHLAGQLAAGASAPGEVAGRVWQGLTAAQTRTEHEFFQAVGDEYYVDYIADEQPEAFRVWEAELRSAAERLSRTTAMEIRALQENAERDCRAK